MKKTEIMTKATRTLNKVGFKLKKHSPEIAVGAGIVGVVTAGVMACKATTKASAITEKLHEDLEAIHLAKEHPEMIDGGYNEEDHQKDLAIAYVQAGVKYAKLYAPSVVLAAASIGCIVYSHKVLKGRNVALAAAYAGIDKSFKQYRERVVERFGVELDKELKHGIKAVEVEETVVNEDGTESTIKKYVDVVNPEGYSEYSRFFAEGCLGWEKDPEMNLYTLKQVQNWANERLQSKGYLYLNEVYEMLGIHKTKAGHVVGWIYDPNNPELDNYVDFSIHDVYTPNEKLNQSRRDFVNGFERNILLDFNVMGNIYDLMY